MFEFGHFDSYFNFWIFDMLSINMCELAHFYSIGLNNLNSNVCIVSNYQIVS